MILRENNPPALALGDLMVLGLAAFLCPGARPGPWPGRKRRKVKKEMSEPRR